MREEAAVGGTIRGSWERLIKCFAGLHLPDKSRTGREMGELWLFPKISEKLTNGRSVLEYNFSTSRGGLES